MLPRVGYLENSLGEKHPPGFPIPSQLLYNQLTHLGGDEVRSLKLAPTIAAALSWLAVSLSAAEPSYFREIRPILQRSCQGCHQPNLKSSDLDLTSYEGLASGGKHGSGLSVVVKYLTGEMKPQMP